MIIPPKLKKGDEIRVIAPARSMAIISKEIRMIAVNRLKDLGLKVTFSKNCEEKDEFNSSSVKSRVENLHEAFKNQEVKAILSAIGGFNSNQILKYLDYELIKKNPKILCGFSDITAIENAITAKTGLVTYSGPHISTFGMIKGIEYTLKYFEKCLINENKYEIIPAEEYSDDLWFLNQEKRDFIRNEGYLIINEGFTEGKIIGGHLRCINSLQGTEFMPSLKNSILFLEEDEEMQAHHFDRSLQSIIHLDDFKEVKGIVIGRFQKKSQITNELLIKIIKSKKELDKIPIIANVDFGHTTPTLTFPIGGTVKLKVKKEKIKLEIVEH
jgi:muramoyltetrapeptide carboxypeptidase